MSELVETIETGDMIEVKKEMGKELVEFGIPIHGFVTVIKNEGREDEEILCEDKPNLLTTDGLDAFHQAIYIDTVASQTGFNFIALTSDTGTPAIGDTVLTGEITTGGLARVLATTRTHTDDTNVSTIEHIFTATAVHNNVQKSGLFDLVTAGILSHINTFIITTLQINDTLKITWTLTMG